MFSEAMSSISSLLALMLLLDRPRKLPDRSLQGQSKRNRWYQTVASGRCLPWESPAFRALFTRRGARSQLDNPA
jgi:hypothetical protein